MGDLYADGPQLRTHVKPRCWHCDSVIAWVVTEPYNLQCRKCRKNNRAGRQPHERPRRAASARVD